MMHGRSRAQLFVVLLLVGLLAHIAWADREYGGRYTAERIANARVNCQSYDWAASIRDAAVAQAQPWVTKSDEELWSMVPGQDLPRCIDVTMDRKVTEGPRRLGCLNCGDKIDAHGNYPYEPQFEKRPWKLTCPACGVVFPTNDFGKYYASAIDERGLFNPAKGDRSLLFNTNHPDPADPLHKFGVDDGFGYIDENGRVHRFIGYYTWKYWRYLQDGLASLANAYLYTGDARYAHKAAILLDRISDVYPEMDWKPYADRGWYHSDGGSGVGKIEGRIWECHRVTMMADAYDKILSGTIDAREVYAFLERQSKRYRLPREKGTRQLLVRNIDDNLLREAVRAIHAGQIIGNEGMHQRTMATCAVALHTEPETSQWLDWIFAPEGGALPGLIVGNLDRDGISPEAGPGYALLWGAGFAEVANLIAEYPSYTKQNLYRDFPQFRATFTAAWRMCALGLATPNIGDSGATGSVQRVALRPDFIAEGYRYTRDPEMAIAAYRANGNSARGLGRDIFARDPDTLAAEIERLGQQAGPRPIQSTLLSGYGLSLMESAANDGTALSCYYGRTIMHGHLDLLNFDLLAFGKWIAPDHGYPEFATTWPHRTAVTLNTLAHNTVVVDQQPQQRHYGGKTRLFQRLPGMTVLQADAPGGYPQAKKYRRTMMLIDTPDENAYLVDLFDITGGSDHVYSFHGPPGKITATELSLVEQQGGTYAGENVPFKSDQGPVGYSWFYNVRRDQNPPAQYLLDWRGEDGKANLRFHGLTACNDVALADADPPQNKPGNPRRLGYSLLHRAAEGELSSRFLGVIEPYHGEPFVRSARRVEGEYAEAIALRVELVDGTVDQIILEDDGEITHVRQIAGEASRTTRITRGMTGTVAKMNRELNGGGWMWLKGSVPAGVELAGQYIHIDNDNERDATYLIHSAERDGGLVKIYCGPISFVRGYAGPTASIRGRPLPRSYEHGFLYDFEEGAPFHIPLAR